MAFNLAWWYILTPSPNDYTFVQVIYTFLKTRRKNYLKSGIRKRMFLVIINFVMLLFVLNACIAMFHDMHDIYI